MGQLNRPRPRRAVLGGILAAVVAVASWWWSAGHGDTDHAERGRSDSSYSSGSSGSSGSRGTDPRSGLPSVALSSLPAQAADTVRLIDAGGPFPYPDHDGGTFGNYEGLLPEESSGYYKEYTVPTPGSPDRGARRIIAGRDGTLYWTADHYEHFSVIRR